MKQPPVPPRAPHNILLVDDNPHGSSARKQLLGELGYTVSIALCAEEALKRIASEHFDMIVTDYKMGKVDGVQLIERVHKLQPEMKTILLSGYVNILGMTEKSTGADAVLNKDAAELPNLMRAVKRLLATEESIRRKPAASQRQTMAARRA